MGNLRWAKPAPPPKNSKVQDGKTGNACVQAAPNGINFFGSASDIPGGPSAINDFLGELAGPVLSGGAEDCLFLDVYVPGSAVRSPKTKSLPVIHWFYGGGYVLGSKNQLQPLLPFYDGSGLITQSGGNVIFVASNYRLGAFGFLAGSTMEKDGLPNAGLWDQRAALQWTKDNIALVGGNPNAVTAMGESAGASSILHHIVAQGGTLDPLFQQAIMLSPAFQPMFDRKGSLEDVYRNFSSFAGCADGSISCLRSKESATLRSANDKLNDGALSGSFAVGPAPDGSFIRQIPSLEFRSGKFWKGLKGLLISHTSDESTLFVDGSIQTDAQTTQFLNALFGNDVVDAGLTKAIEKKYPPVSGGAGPYKTQGQRVRAFIRDSSFTCNNRWLADAYAGKTYSMQYSLTPGWHATDLLPAFWSTGLSSSPLGNALALALPLLSAFSFAYKSYLTSFVRSGSPNSNRAAIWVPPAINWPTTDASGEKIGNVLNAGDLGFSVISDDKNLKSACDFWVDFEAAVTINGGYSPPGSVVPTTLLSGSDLEGPSDNY